MKKILILVFVIGLTFGSIFLAKSIQESDVSRQKALLQTAIENALSTCYALEGFYPAKVDYLIDHYGIQADSNRYFIYYQTFGANIRPEVTVYRKGSSK